MAEHAVVAPGETSVLDEHYGSPRARPRRAARPRTAAEHAILALGEAGEAFLKGAAAAGVTKLAPELEVIAGLERARGRTALLAALERAVAFGRWRAADVRSILEAGDRCGPTNPTGRGARRGSAAGAHAIPRRLRAGAAVMTAVPAALAPDLVAGLRRLKLAALRRIAPEVLQSATTQRWTPEELLRTLVETEIAAPDESNARARLKAASFPVTKTLDEFDLSVSPVPSATFDYLASLEWIAAKENACLLGPAGTGKSHLLVALGQAAVAAGRRVRYFTAAELVETLYRGMADNSVGKIIDQTLRSQLVIVDLCRTRNYADMARGGNKASLVTAGFASRWPPRRSA